MNRIDASVRFSAAILAFSLSAAIASATVHAEPVLKRVSGEFIAALGEPGASSGTSAEDWGIWRVDPGPRGVRLKDFQILNDSRGLAPAGWSFDAGDWWLEENGLIMEKPDFPLPPGKYRVTGDREVAATLTITPKDQAGTQHWSLSDGATLYDVTHLPCRSARYTPLSKEDTCSPARAPTSQFRVPPGAPMPAVQGCSKQDYAVLFVIGVYVEENE